MASDLFQLQQLRSYPSVQILPFFFYLNTFCLQLAATNLSGGKWGLSPRGKGRPLEYLNLSFFSYFLLKTIKNRHFCIDLEAKNSKKGPKVNSYQIASEFLSFERFSHKLRFTRYSQGGSLNLATAYSLSVSKEDSQMHTPTTTATNQVVKFFLLVPT